MVIAQIREATSAGREVAWSSQPGAIRRWDNRGDRASSQEMAYKLYSDEVMRTGDWTDFQNDFSDMQNWSEEPAHFVDLNEPVIRGEKVYYPVVHPAASVVPKRPKIGNDSSGVEGFSYVNNGRPELNEQGELGRKAAQIAGATDGHLPMPVKWLYQLADGTIGVLGSSPTQVEGYQGYQFQAIAGSGSPSKENPIVSRMAYWADDETTKLNINTHAGGLAWDIPKAGGAMDMAMAKHQPAQKEWQRYPGHPATTHLSPALAPGVLSLVNDRDAMELLFRVVPRIVGGGSESGTRVLDTRNPEEENGLVPDTEPLFPSLDDMVMRADRTFHEFPDESGTPIPEDELSEYLERSKFFITVTSRAPEVNIFNLPKIAMWPIFNAERSSAAQSVYQRKLSKFDQLIHYCASVGKRTQGSKDGYDYIFRREKADDKLHDYYNIGRNQELYLYLDELLSQNVPGYGESFREKYGQYETRQILTQIFDYIRATNLHDDTIYKDFEDAFQVDNSDAHLTYTNFRDANEVGFGQKGHGQVTPIEISVNTNEPTRGFGRFFTLSGVHTHAICVAQEGRLPYSMFPGTHAYPRNRGWEDQPEGVAWSNLPPLPAGLTRNSPAGEMPSWLAALETTNPAEFEAAFKPINWNWNLVYLNDRIRGEILRNPDRNKFNRSIITKADCENMRLQPGERMVQAILLFDLFSPSIGWCSINPDMEVHISAANGGPKFSSTNMGMVGYLGFEGRGAMGTNSFIWATNWAKPHKQGGARSWGGLLPFGYILSARQPLQQRHRDRHVWHHLADGGSTLHNQMRSRLTPLDKGYSSIASAVSQTGRELLDNDANDVAQAYRYDLVTVPFKISNNQVRMTSDVVTFKFFDKGDHTEASAPDSPKPNNPYDDDYLLQKIEVEIPAFSVEAPEMSAGYSGWYNEFDALVGQSASPIEIASLTADPANHVVGRETKSFIREGKGNNSRAYGRMTQLVRYWDNGESYVRPNDLVQSVAIRHGDTRLVMPRKEITPADNLFVKHRNYGNARMAHGLTNAVGNVVAGNDPKANENYLIVWNLPNHNRGPYNRRVPLPFSADTSESVQRFGDFDNGAGTMIDGPYINKPDEGNVHSLKTKKTQEVLDNHWEERRNYGDFPYFSHPEYAETGGPAYFSPNRIVSGPGMFGSLPSQSIAGRPWQTLLFRPAVQGAGRYDEHPGSSDGGKEVPDHILMDMFWMPVVEPYAISEPLSTAGKVNMNYEIVPFLNIERTTALRGVFRSEYMLCVPNKLHASYKHGRGRGQGYHWRDNPYGGEIQNTILRKVIKDDETLAQFETRFNQGEDAFLSASEICEIHLVRQELSSRLGSSKGSMGSRDSTVQSMEDGTYWAEHVLVGDNSREKPYANIHSRLTTKSNTFKVHYRAQVLKQARRSDDNNYSYWVPELDSMQAEYRGSSIVERFVDPNSPNIDDFAERTNRSDKNSNLDKNYMYRVVNPRRFAP